VTLNKLSYFDDIEVFNVGTFESKVFELSFKSGKKLHVILGFIV